MQPETSNIIWPFKAVKPREVQMRALSFGYGKPGFAYFMRQRLGKTWTAYAEYVLLRQEKKVRWCIVVCPNNLKEQWQEAIEQVDPFTPILVYNSQNKKATEYFFANNKSGGVFIINYESVHIFIKKDGFNGMDKFDLTQTYIVADESTKIKDHSAKMTKACHELAAACAYKRVLTGKPTANSNADMWSQLKFIDATSRNFTQHKYYFCVVGGWQGRTVVSNVNTEQLKREMAPHCYIAEDKYIKGFEKVYEPIRRVNLTGSQLEQYKSMEDDLMVELGDVTLSAPIILTKYLRLQQISSGIGGDPDGVQHNLISPEKNPRLRELMEILENEIDHKVIICCRFKLSISNIQKMLDEAGYKYITIMGGTPNLEEQKKLFNESPDVNICIGQISSIAYGHTLCGLDELPCDSVIFYETTFSLLERAQCESRPEKMGREKPISYYDFFASKMDRYMIETLRRKEDASMALMGYNREYGIRPNLTVGESNAARSTD